MNLVSVVVPTYNEEKTIEGTLKALVRQSYRNFEIIIIDSGSKDGTLEILKKYQRNYRRIKLRKIKEKNIANARNTGLKHAKGEIIAFLDCGRIPPRNWLKKILKSFRNKNIVGVGGSFKTFKNTKYNLFELFTALDKIYRSGFKKQIVNIVCTGNSAFKKSVIKKVGGFDETFAIRGENSDFCYRVSKKYRILYDPKIYVYYKDSLNFKNFLREHFFNGFYHFLLYKKHPRMVFGDSYRKLHFTMQAPILLFSFLFFLIYSKSIQFLVFPFILLVSFISILNIYFLIFVTSKKNIITTLFFLPLVILRPFTWLLGLLYSLLNISFRQMAQFKPELRKLQQMY